MNLKDILAKNKKGTKKDTAKNVAVGAGIGTALGLLAGVLFAPKSGKETREDIAKNAKNAAETVKGTLNDVKGKISELGKAKEDQCCEDKACCGCAEENSEKIG